MYSFTRHFHVTIFVTLNYGRQKSTFAILEVVNFLFWVYHIVVAEPMFLRFDFNLTIKFVDILPLSNIILNLLNIYFILQVLTQPCGIGE